MNYKSKQHLTEALTTAALSIGYVVFALGSKSPNADNLQAWGITILVFIGIMMVVNIFIQIIFHFLYSAVVAVEANKKQEEHLVERIIKSSLQQDERDREINHRAAYVASICISIGFILSMAILAFGGQAVMSLHVLLAAFVLSSLVHSVMNIMEYEKDGLDG